MSTILKNAYPILWCKNDTKDTNSYTLTEINTTYKTFIVLFTTSSSSSIYIINKLSSNKFYR